MEWLSVLQTRNPLLFWFGLVCLAGALIGMLMARYQPTILLGVNAWIKPIKFFLSVWIFSWTMGWLLYELKSPVAVKAYSIMVVIVMLIELGIISWQAGHGRLSHFNVSTARDKSLFMIMGIAITILTAWTAVIGLQFFGSQTADLPPGYRWGIRLGILFFVVFAFEGGMMGARLSHSVGGPDGGPGIAVLNWSKKYGDLRVAHFFGIHSLQLLPLLGYYVTKTTTATLVVSIAYFAIVTFFLLQAMKGIPLLKSTV